MQCQKWTYLCVYLSTDLFSKWNGSSVRWEAAFGWVDLRNSRLKFKILRQYLKRTIPLICFYPRLIYVWVFCTKLTIERCCFCCHNGSRTFSDLPPSTLNNLATEMANTNGLIRWIQQIQRQNQTPSKEKNKGWESHGDLISIGFKITLKLEPGLKESPATTFGQFINGTDSGSTFPL